MYGGEVASPTITDRWWYFPGITLHCTGCDHICRFISAILCASTLIRRCTAPQENAHSAVTNAHWVAKEQPVLRELHNFAGSPRTNGIWSANNSFLLSLWKARSPFIVNAVLPLASCLIYIYIYVYIYYILPYITMISFKYFSFWFLKYYDIQSLCIKSKCNLTLVFKSCVYIDNPAFPCVHIYFVLQDNNIRNPKLFAIGHL